MSTGKKLGLIGFWFFLLIISFCCFCVSWKMFKTNELEVGLLTGILGAVTTMFTITWVAIGSKKFAPQNKEEDEGDDCK